MNRDCYLIFIKVLTSLYTKTIVIIPIEIKIVISQTKQVVQFDVMA